MKKYRIGIDCRLAGRHHAGIGRYIQNLVLELLKIQPSNFTLVLFFYDALQAHEVLATATNKSNLELVYAPIRHYTFKEQFKMPAIFRAKKLDLLHIPHFNIPIFYPGKIIITIHDLLWHEQKGLQATTLSPWKYHLKYFFYRLTTNLAIKKALQILVPAQTIAQTVEHYYPTVKNKITVTKEGISDKFLTAKLTKQQSQQKQLVYTGSLYPHKNIKVILKALQKLKDYKLILVGARSIFLKQTQKLIHDFNLEKQVEFAGFLPDEDLIKLYQKSTALVQPSLSEGFGLTGVEAMAVGLPVICSDIPIFHEIYQDNALYFDPHQSDSFVKSLKNLEKQPNSFYQQLPNIRQQYQWSKMAKTILNSYQKFI